VGISMWISVCGYQCVGIRVWVSVVGTSMWVQCLGISMWVFSVWVNCVGISVWVSVCGIQCAGISVWVQCLGFSMWVSVCVYTQLYFLTLPPNNYQLSLLYARMKIVQGSEMKNMVLYWIP